MAQTFYPAYIPGKWIHYTHHKKKRIRKKYQNRIRRKIRRHKADAQTLSFLLTGAAARYSSWIGYKPPEIEIPEIPETTLDALEELGKAFEELKDAVLEAIQPIVDYLVKVAKKFFKWAGDFWDHLWCDNKHWWYMAEHHKKRRIRKKYRNKIKREATRRAGELLELLATDDSEDDETASDDEEGP